MTVPRPPTTGRPVEAAADRVMLLWSLIKMVPDHELTLLRSSLLEKLSEQQHLAEDETRDCRTEISASECSMEKAEITRYY